MEHIFLRKKIHDKNERDNISINEEKALSNFDINNLLEGKTKVLTYKSLPYFRNINQLLEPYKNFVLLYMSSNNFGHWCCIIKHHDRIEFFDPYGGKNIPDKELDSINDKIKNITNQNYPYLTKLLYDTGYPIEYNNYEFQQHGRDINTCGRHCAVRIFFKNLLLDEYYELMRKISQKTNLSYDKIVTIMTN